VDDLEKLRQDVAQGTIGSDRLVELVFTLQRKLQEHEKALDQTTQELQRARQRIEELERKLGISPTVKVDQPFSVREEEKRQEARGKKKPRKKTSKGRRGRITTKEKIALASRTEKVFPKGVAEEACWLSHTRPIWRLENGQAVLVAYDVYRGPGGQYGRIPGALGRSEYGLEIIVAIAYQVYIVGLSFDKVCVLMNFFQQLKLRKSQVDALLHQLSRHWESEFDTLCALLANSAVVYTDETSWSINSVWTFLSEKVRLLFFGVHKDADTLATILDPETFQGIVVSDDAAVYANFTHCQKCWAHLLRKAIKLTLLSPQDEEYRRLADELLAIYREACRVQSDRRLGDAGRQRKVSELDDRILELCGPVWMAELPPLEGLEDDYRLLCNEVMRLMLAQQLFTFVTAPPVTTPLGETQPVAGTNNEPERTLRAPAMARPTGRTNKAVCGARRQTVITSVLESLRCQLRLFTLQTVVEQIERWTVRGRSCFTDLLNKLKRRLKTDFQVVKRSPLDILLALPAE
jgi:hypothetical protein